MAVSENYLSVIFSTYLLKVKRKLPIGNSASTALRFWQPCRNDHDQGLRPRSGPPLGAASGARSEHTPSSRAKAGMIYSSQLPQKINC
jgi:hypothetical protein